MTNRLRINPFVHSRRVIGCRRYLSLHRRLDPVDSSAIHALFSSNWGSSNELDDQAIISIVSRIQSYTMHNDKQFVSIPSSIIFELIELSSKSKCLQTPAGASSLCTLFSFFSELTGSKVQNSIFNLFFRVGLQSFTMHSCARLRRALLQNSSPNTNLALISMNALDLIHPRDRKEFYQSITTGVGSSFPVDLTVVPSNGVKVEDLFEKYLGRTWNLINDLNNQSRLSHAVDFVYRFCDLHDDEVVDRLIRVSRIDQLEDQEEISWVTELFSKLVHAMKPERKGPILESLSERILTRVDDWKLEKIKMIQKSFRAARFVSIPLLTKLVDIATIRALDTSHTSLANFQMLNGSFILYHLDHAPELPIALLAKISRLETHVYVQSRFRREICALSILAAEDRFAFASIEQLRMLLFSLASCRSFIPNADRLCAGIMDACSQWARRQTFALTDLPNLHRLATHRGHLVDVIPLGPKDEDFFRLIGRALGPALLKTTADTESFPHVDVLQMLGVYSKYLPHHKDFIHDALHALSNQLVHVRQPEFTTHLLEILASANIRHIDKYLQEAIRRLMPKILDFRPMELIRTLLLLDRLADITKDDVFRKFYHRCSEFLGAFNFEPWNDVRLTYVGLFFRLVLKLSRDPQFDQKVQLALLKNVLEAIILLEEKFDGFQVGLLLNMLEQIDPRFKQDEEFVTIINMVKIVFDKSRDPRRPGFNLPPFHQCFFFKQEVSLKSFYDRPNVSRFHPPTRMKQIEKEWGFKTRILTPEEEPEVIGEVDMQAKFDQME